MFACLGVRLCQTLVRIYIYIYIYGRVCFDLLDTPYNNVITLGNARDKANRRELIRETNKVNKAQERETESAARELVANNTGISNQLLDRHGISEDITYDTRSEQSIHASHVLKTVAESTDALFCERCGAWTTGTKLGTLTEPCVGIVSAARKFQHRLLVFGIIPKPGARIPADARIKRRRVTQNFGQ